MWRQPWRPLAETFEPVRVETVWIVLGYLACLVGLVPQFFYVAAGGFFAGISIVQAKKDPEEWYHGTAIYSRRSQAWAGDDGLKHGIHLYRLLLAPGGTVRLKYPAGATASVSSGS